MRGMQQKKKVVMVNGVRKDQEKSGQKEIENIKMK